MGLKSRLISRMVTTLLVASPCTWSAADAGAFGFARAPVGIDVASIVSQDGSGRPAAVLDTLGRQFVATYDGSGRLISLCASRGANASDIRQISYLPDGHVWSVAFGNRYGLYFEYPDAAHQRVRDALGNWVTRTTSAPNKWVAALSSDPEGRLLASLTRLEAVIALFPTVSGLSSATSSTPRTANN